MAAAILAMSMATSGATADMQTATMDLAGPWAFQLDPKDEGVPARWYATSLSGEMRLPGSVDEQRLGERVVEPELGRLTRSYRYVGPAWYQKTATIPETWRGKHVELVLERVHWTTQVWLDESYIGAADSLSVPQVFDLSGWAVPGTHRLTLRIDNRIHVNVGHAPAGLMWAHALTDETQTNWNGVIGRVELVARDPVWIKTAQVYPELEQGRARIVIEVRNATGGPIAGTLRASAECDGHQLGPVDAAIDCEGDVVRPELILPIDASAKVWDEFSPHVYTLTAELSAHDRATDFADRYTARFGLRTFRAEGRDLLLNKRRVFLRGNLDCCIFPLTGYPPMTLDGWRREFETLKSYGMNSARFHSWCPLEAAFEVADELGFMLQIECPLWDGYGHVGDLADRAAYIRFEAQRLVDAYGNHPSFCLMSMGNELGDGKEHYLRYLVEVLRAHDPRRLYTCTTHPSDRSRNDDYFVTAATEDGGTRGLPLTAQSQPGTDFDYREALVHYTRPVIAHEVGQYCFFPQFDWTAKYSGHLKAHYFDIFRQRFLQHHPEGQDKHFMRASGVFAGLLYKAEIEAQLRTPEIAGFQLLGLQDFPGQGVALVGMLDPFWDSKGLVAPEAWRRFCSPTVPLVRIPKHVWQPGEVFEAEAEVRHHGPFDLPATRWRWRIIDSNGNQLASDTLGPIDVPTGGITALGVIRLAVPEAARPCEWTLELAQEGGEAVNTWRLWVYPRLHGKEAPSGVLYARVWDEPVKEALAAGKTVLLNPKPQTLDGAVPVRFGTVAWSKQLFPQQPSSMGILCDPKHPALALFPTRFHADWQWYALLRDGAALNLNELPVEASPIVSVIDDYNTSNRLGVLLEAQVGPGRLLLCTLDLDRGLADQPVRQWFRKSLFEYAASDLFRPQHTVTVEALDAVLKEATLALYRSAAGAPEKPESLDRAVLHVHAATKVPAMRSDLAWSLSHDDVIACLDGFEYEVTGMSWRDSGGSAWYGGNLALTVVCPKGFIGTLSIRFHDWNGQGRRSRIFFEGRDLGPLSSYEQGVWLNFPVTVSMSADGMLTLRTQAEAGPNVMITHLALAPGS